MGTYNRTTIKRLYQGTLSSSESPTNTPYGLLECETKDDRITNDYKPFDVEEVQYIDTRYPGMTATIEIRYSIDTNVRKSTLQQILNATIALEF